MSSSPLPADRHTSTNSAASAQFPDAAQGDKLFRQMFSDSPHPMWMFDLQTLQFLDVNAAALAVYGYSQSEFLALTIPDLLFPEARSALRARLAEHVAAPALASNRGVRRHQSKSGESLWMEITAYRISHGGRPAVLTTAQNVTERHHAQEALRRSEQKLSLHIQLSPLAVLEVALDGTISAWNPSAEKIFGYSAEEALGQDVLALIVPPEDRGPLAALQHEMHTRRVGTRSTNRNRTKTGEVILCEWHNTPIIDDSGSVLSLACMGRDITHEAAASERLRRSEAHKAALLNAAMDCIISINSVGRIVDWNAAAERTFGCSQAEAAGQRITDLILPPSLRSSYQHGLMHYLNNGNWPAFYAQIELPAQRRDGTAFQAEISAAALSTSGEMLYTIYLRDISERKQMEAEREALLCQTEALLAAALERADHDPLTGLLNHRAFHKRLQEAVEAARQTAHKAQRVSVLLLDLDNFKFFNDAYGHGAGDDVLRQIAHSFAATCRAGSTLARFGGDEFALLLPGASEADAAAAAALLQAAALLAGYHPPGYETSIPFHLSVGIASFPEDAGSPAALLEAADARLRVAKSGGDAGSPALHVRRTLARSVGGFTMLDALVTAVDNKDRYTRRHSEDVMHHSLQIAQALGLSVETQRVIEVAALLHDVGKIGIPDAILRKPGRLSAEDYEAIKQHPLMGSVIVGAVAGFEETLDAVRHHHERWDGGGYPFGLVGEETPLTARLMAVADAYSAMTMDRPYRKGMAPPKALAILEDGAGTQWDPACVHAFLHARRAACGEGPCEESCFPAAPAGYNPKHD